MWMLNLDFLQDPMNVPKWEKITQLNLKFSPGVLAHHTATVYNNAAYIIGGIKANG